MHSKHKDRSKKTIYIAVIVIIGFLVFYYVRWSNGNKNESAENTQGNTNTNTGTNARIVNSTAVGGAPQEGIPNINVNENNQNVNSNAAVAKKEVVYSNLEGQWSIQASLVSEYSEGDITTLQFSDGSITVMPESYESMVINSIGSIAEEEVVLGGKTAKKVTGASAKDGSPISFILLKNAGQLYQFQGGDNFLSHLAPETFQFVGE